MSKRSGRLSEMRNCKYCNVSFNLTKFVWRPRLTGQRGEYCTNICTNCHPDFNTKCSKCSILKPNSEFLIYQLKRKKKQMCKVCKPYIQTEYQKYYRKTRQKDPAYRKGKTD